MIKLDKQKKIITNGNGEVLDYITNIEKVSKQGYPFLLNDDLTWNKSVNEASGIVRQERDKVISIVDCFFLSDTTKITTADEKAALKVKRQLLRDITENITDIDDAVDRFNSIRILGFYFQYVVR